MLALRDELADLTQQEQAQFDARCASLVEQMRAERFSDAEIEEALRVLRAVHVRLSDVESVDDAQFAAADKQDNVRL